MTLCSRCRSPLDVAAVLCESDRCTTCETYRIQLAADPWAFFVRTLRAKVRADGTLHVNDVRESLRGRVEPKQIGLLWRRARTAGLIHGGDEWEPSTDAQGGNADKVARVYRAGEALTRSAA
jgi:hypothetical protein